MPATKKTAKKATTKTAAKKATVSKKAAAEKASDCACKTEGACKSPAGRKLTRVIAKYDAGWGNQLFIRGAVSTGMREFPCSASAKTSGSGNKLLRKAM